MRRDNMFNYRFINKLFIFLGHNRINKINIYKDVILCLLYILIT